jgi:Ca-activated chloride channel family protein
MAALCFFVVIGSGLAGAETGPQDRQQGLFFHTANSSIPALAIGTTVEVKVTGIIARTKVTQIFKNASPEWVEGIYLFPLPDDAAVDTLRMKVGNRTIRGVIQEKQEARQTYEAAKQQGIKASLVEQQRPDVFTTTVANVGPGETVEVAIELQQVVKWEQGRFRLRFPTGFPTKGVHSVERDNYSFAFHADLNPGFPLASVESPSHAITVTQGKSFRYAVDLKNGVAPSSSDLVLEWAPAVGKEPRAVYYSEEVDGERYSLLMVMPPDTPDAVASRLPRETIFIIDNSGSMSGEKLEQARQALLFGLSRLQLTDWFNVIRFSTTATPVFPASVRASAGAVEKARRWVGELAIEGGTQMLPALQIAFRNPPPAGLVPQVIFATDGELDDEAQVVSFLNANVGRRRLFPIGIGTAPNAHLLGSFAALGRGSFTAIDDVNKVATAMTGLFSQLESPMLREIDVQWSDPGAEAWPARVPDLYLGEPLVVTARTGAGSGPVNVSGLRGGDAWQDSFPAAAEFKGAGIDKLWARKKIQALTDSLRDGGNWDEVKRQITELGLRHHLVTDHTSLVAIDEAPTAPAGIEPVTHFLSVNPPQISSQCGEPVEDVITVTAESPMLDERRITTGATVSQTELEKIPTARDPWVVLQPTPGVLTDRVNVGGKESGQQARYVGPGSGGDQAVWSVDGMVVTDMAATGSSPGYYDFDVFGEMQVTTGGSDAQPTAANSATQTEVEKILTARDTLPALPDDEAKALCEEIWRSGWAGLTLERVLLVAPFQADVLRKADAAGLLRGLVALMLHDKGCAEPPADVLAEAKEYSRRFGVVDPW